jgi:hypothetical protein
MASSGPLRQVRIWLCSSQGCWIHGVPILLFISSRMVIRSYVWLGIEQHEAWLEHTSFASHYMTRRYIVPFGVTLPVDSFRAASTIFEREVNHLEHMGANAFFTGRSNAIQMENSNVSHPCLGDIFRTELHAPKC